MFQLSTADGLTVAISPIGATVCSIQLHGQELTLGYHTEADYQTDPFYLGATVGPYANRIAQAQFVLDGQQYPLSANEGRHCLHGGPGGLHHRCWQLVCQQTDALTLYCELADGEDGFPGLRQIYVQFRVSSTTLQISFRAQSSQPTVLSLTNHCYFNLDPQATDISDHWLQLPLHHYLALDQEKIPTGQLLPLSTLSDALAVGTPLTDVLSRTGGLDHCFVSQAALPAWQTLARLWSPDQQLCLTVASDLPALQVYSGDGLSTPFYARQGICLEAQYWPDAPNQPAFPATVLRPGQHWQHQIHYQFSRQPGPL